MTERVKVSKINETWLHIDTDISILQEMSEVFSFYVPGFMHMPKFKNKVWDGKIRLVQPYKQKTYVGLYRQLKEFCETRGYEFEGYPSQDTNVTPEDLVEFVKSLNLHSGNKPIEFRDYQYAAIFKSLKHKRFLVQSPTGSGKSAQIYAIIRYLLDADLRVLLLVPTVSLVTQMKSDFVDYSSHNGWNVETNVHVIYAGQSKSTKKHLVISTWQSLQSKSKVPDEFFEMFDCVIVDETHLAKSTEISGILEKCINAEYRLGLTGSLDKSQTHKQILTSLFGETLKVATTRELIDRKLLSDIKIKALVMKYDESVRKSLKKAEYPNEMDFIVRNEKRNKFIRNLVVSLKGNTLVLFQYVEKHGDVLNDLISSKDPSRPVYYVHGGTEAEAREEIRHLTEKGENVIIIASVGVFSTGVNIKRIHNIVFTSPTKSMIRVIQSIGRGLRVASDKTHVKLFDIADDLRVGKHENHTWKHFGERLRIYSSEQFEYEIIEVNIV